MEEKNIYEYDSEKRRKAKHYSKSKLISGLINSIIIPIITLYTLLSTNTIQYIAQYTQQTTIYISLPLFIIILATILEIVQFPIKIYMGYFYEHKYDLSNQNLKEWFTDYAKNLGLSYTFNLIILTTIYTLINLTTLWWIYTWIFLTLLLVFIQFIYPNYIVPIFYDLKPYEDEEQKDKLKKMCEKAGIKQIKNVLIADESQRSKKPNAMLTGLGKTKKIILFDNLADNFTAEEIETVIGHELGHYNHKDTFRMTLISSTIILAGLYIIKTLIQYNLFNIQPQNLSIIPLLLLFYSIYQVITMPIQNNITKYIEKQADNFSLQITNKPNAFQSSMKRLADMSLADHNPPWIVEKIFADHPTIKKRVEKAKKYTKE